MDPERLKRIGDCEWELPQTGPMRVPGVIYADEALIRSMDEKVPSRSRTSHAARHRQASFAMPDAHWGYGFPIGGVAAFDPDEGVVSAGGVGFDISCGVRTLLTGLTLARSSPCGDCSRTPSSSGFRGTRQHGSLRLSPDEMDRCCWAGRAGRWSEATGGRRISIVRRSAAPCPVPTRTGLRRGKRRQRDEMGTLGSGNHYLELQHVVEIHDRAAPRRSAFAPATWSSASTAARASRHQIGTEFLREMAITAKAAGIALPDRELACAPIRSPVGRRYLGAMRAAINCALANRQILTHLTRQAFRAVLPGRSSSSSTTCRTTPAKSSGTSSTASRASSTSIAKARRGIRPRTSRPAAALYATGQPVLIGAAWAPLRTCWSARGGA